MAFLLGPKEKKSRALGENLFLKAERSQSQKSAMVRRAYRPGMHGKMRRSLSEYGEQLSEKQKLKLSYGLREQQLARYVEESLSQQKLPAADALIRALETRVDNAVFRLGLAPARSIARSLVSHGHIMVNGRRADIPSMHVRPGDAISIRPESQKKKAFEGIDARLKKYQPPSWLALDPKSLTGTLTGWPTAEEARLPFSISLILEFYSR